MYVYNDVYIYIYIYMKFFWVAVFAVRKLEWTLALTGRSDQGLSPAVVWPLDLATTLNVRAVTKFPHKSGYHL